MFLYSQDALMNSNHQENLKCHMFQYVSSNNAERTQWPLRSTRFLFIGSQVESQVQYKSDFSIHVLYYFCIKNVYKKLLKCMIPLTMCHVQSMT